MNTASTGGSSQRKRRGPSQNFMFPTKLHKILSRPDFSHIITWTEDGRAWKVLDKRLFSAVIMPEYFSQSKYPSFVRQVNGWGYRRISRGPDKTAYYHELFLRGCDHLVQFMDRTAVCDTSAAKKQCGGGNCRGSGTKEADPDFSAFPPLPPLDPNAPVADPGRRYGVGRPSSGGSTAKGKSGKKKRSRKAGDGSAMTSEPEPSSVASSSTIPDTQLSGVATAAAGSNSPNSVSSSVRTKSPPADHSIGAGAHNDTQGLQSDLSSTMPGATNNTAFGWNARASSMLPNVPLGSQQQQQQQQGFHQRFDDRLQHIQGQVATFQSCNSLQASSQQQLEHHNHQARSLGGDGAAATVGALSNLSNVGSRAVAEQDNNVLPVGGTNEAAGFDRSSQQHSVMFGSNVSSHMTRQQPSHASGVNFQARQQLHRTSEACSSPPRSRPCLMSVGGACSSQQEEKQSSPTYRAGTYPRSIQAQLQRLQEQQRQLQAQSSGPARLEDILSQARLAQEWAPQVAAPVHHASQPRTYSTGVSAAPVQIQASHLQQPHQVQHHVHWHSSTAAGAPGALVPPGGGGAPPSRHSRSESAGSHDSEDHRGIYEALEQFCAGDENDGGGNNNDDSWLAPPTSSRAAGSHGGEGKFDDDIFDEVMTDADHRGDSEPCGPTVLPFGTNALWPQN